MHYYELKNRVLTKVSGFQKFDIDHKKLAKKLKKKLGTGIQNISEDEFQLQGLHKWNMVEIINAHLGLKEDDYVFSSKLKQKKNVDKLKNLG